MRPSGGALAAVGRALTAGRDQLRVEWAEWVQARLGSDDHLPSAIVERQLGVLLDLLIMLTGAWRRESQPVWLAACEWYGRTAAQRGLAAGEIVEEFQQLREILIRELSAVIAAMPGRQSIAGTIRLNRILDTGIAHAVVGYTDALVESLLDRQGIPVGVHDEKETAIEERLQQFETELARLNERPS